jgi:glycosyltransferase involved in cell wall biosynthesis
MKVAVLVKVYNEEDLLPFFLSHYDWADEILINLDMGTNDRSEEIIKSFSNTKIIWSESNGQMNDGRLVKELNEIACQSDADWIILVDSDELVFAQNFANPRRVLEVADGNVIIASMWQIYRHVTDLDLDPAYPAVFQRRHGDPNRITGFSACYTKPIIIKPEIEPRWFPGNHALEPNKRIVLSQFVRFDGAHWTLPDVRITTKRRLQGRRDRFDDEEKRMGWGGQHFHATEETILAEYELHKNDPQVF